IGGYPHSYPRRGEGYQFRLMAWLSALLVVEGGCSTPDTPPHSSRLTVSRQWGGVSHDRGRVPNLLRVWHRAHAACLRPVALRPRGCWGSRSSPTRGWVRVCFPTTTTPNCLTTGGRP